MRFFKCVRCWLVLTKLYFFGIMAYPDGTVLFFRKCWFEASISGKITCRNSTLKIE